MLKFYIAKLKSTVGSAVFVGMMCGSFAARADVIADRKANFKVNAAAMKSISAALGAGVVAVVAGQLAAVDACVPAHDTTGEGMKS